MSSTAGNVGRLRSGDRLAHVAKKWGLLAIVIVMPGGLVALALLWWLDRQNTLRARLGSSMVLAREAGTENLKRVARPEPGLRP